MNPSWQSRIQNANKSFTVVLFGSSQVLFEPLYLQALAQHPQCGRILLIPYYEPVTGRLTANAHQFIQLASHLSTLESFDLKPTGEVTPSGWQRHTVTRTPSDAVSATIQHDSCFSAYDITELLRSREADGGFEEAKAIASRVRHHCETHKPEPLYLRDADFYINANHMPEAARVAKTLNPRLSFLYDPEFASFTCDKTRQVTMMQKLGLAAEDYLPHSRVVDSVQNIKDFIYSRQYGEIILKTSHGSAGNGIYHVYKTENGDWMGNFVSDDKMSPQPLEKMPFRFPFRFPLQAVEMLDVSKGDMRVVLSFGQVIGGYNRLPAENSLLCNIAKGGTVAPIDLRADLSEAEYQKLEKLAGALEKQGIHYACIDLLADKAGRRYLSEINTELLASLGSLRQCGQLSDAALTGMAADTVQVIEQNHQRLAAR